MPAYQKTVLDNGISVVTEDHPQSRATACGIWVSTGTRDEKPNVMGVTHFLEHLVFKGTKTRSAYDLAKMMEAVGGELNAHTTREYTCFHTLSLHEHLDLAIDVLVDLVINANFPFDEYDKEKQVVLQEIASSQDNIEDYIYDLFFEYYYKNSPLGYNILGTEETIGNMTRRQVMDYYQSKYAPPNIIVSAAGRLEHVKVVERLEKGFRRFRRKARKSKREKPKVKTFKSIFEKDLEQIHMLVGMPTTSFPDKRRFEAFIVNALLGGGMTSKLYQKIREERGLVYSIYSNLITFTDSGISMTYASTTPQHFKVVMNNILKEFEILKKEGVSQADLDLFKTQVRGGILLGADDVDNRMNSLGVNEMIFKKYRPVDEVVAEIEAVNLDSMHEFLDRDFDINKLSYLFAGPITDKQQKWIEEL